MLAFLHSRGKPSLRSAHSLTCAGLRAPDRTENDRSCSPIRPAALMAFGLVDGSTRSLHVRLSNHWFRPAASLKALSFEKNARKTQNKTRRERLLRAARCYLLATGEELEFCPGRRLRIK